jgi:hypothetical protein
MRGKPRFQEKKPRNINLFIYFVIFEYLDIIRRFPKNSKYKIIKIINFYSSKI